MSRGFWYPAPVFLDGPITANPDCGADNADYFSSIHHFFTVSLVFGHHGFVRVAEQGQREIVFVDEFRVRLRVVGRDANHCCPGFPDFRPEIAEPARFLRTSRGIVFRIKVNDDVLAFEVLQGDRPVILVGECKIRAGMPSSIAINQPRG